MSPTTHYQPTDPPVLRLHVVQADYGDCLLLQYGAEGAAKHILIDGGPDGIYACHLKYKLQEVAAHHGRLDIASEEGKGSTFTALLPKLGSAAEKTPAA